jgi:hypothetical protein
MIQKQTSRDTKCFCRCLIVRSVSFARYPSYPICRLICTLINLNLQAPKVFGNVQPQSQVRSTYRKATRFLNLKPSDLNASSCGSDLNESTSFHTPRGRAAEQLEEMFEDAHLYGDGDFELNRKRLVNMILTELGHTPADDDLEFVA